MKTGIIYKATSPSGNVYIGQTTITLSKRRNSHCYSAFKRNNKAYNYKFSKAIRKYSTSAIKWTVLHSNIPANNLNELEIKEIRKHNSYKHGYNSTLGGEGSSGLAMSKKTRKKMSEALKGNKRCLGHKRSQETRKKMSKAKKGNKSCLGRKLSAETKKKISDAGKGNKNWLGKHHSKETKKKMSEAKSGNKLSEETKKKISYAISGENNGRAKLNLKLAQEIRTKYSTNKYTKKELAKKYNVGKSTIRDVINCLRWNK